MTDLDLNEMREQLAAIEHERWADWQRWLHGLCDRREDDSLVIPAVHVVRWERQIATPYAELSEAEKISDRKQVDRYWPLLAPLLAEVERPRKEARIKERESGEAMLYHDQPHSPCRHVGPDSEQVSPSST